MTFTWVPPTSTASTILDRPRTFNRVLLLFFEQHGIRRGCRKTHLVALDFRNQPHIDVVMMPLVRAFATVLLRQLDPVAFDLVDGPDMDAIRADDLHVLFDACHVLLP